MDWPDRPDRRVHGAAQGNGAVDVRVLESDDVFGADCVGNGDGPDACERSV